MKESEIRNPDTFKKYLDLVAQDVAILFCDASSFEYTSCPACTQRAERVVLRKGIFNYTQCDRCQTFFVNPRPRIDDLERFYANSVSTSYWVTDFFMPVAEARREKMFRPRAVTVAEQFAELNLGRVGDIGAGFGLFLEELRKLVPTAELVAIEPSQQMAEICRSKKFDVIESFLERIPDGVGGFDLLTSFELFEHLHTPSVFLEHVHRLLKPGGRFLMTTLNGLGFDIQVLWEHSRSVSPPHHLNFFNPASASLLLERLGFRVIESSTPGKLDWDIVEQSCLRDGVEIGRFWDSLARSDNQHTRAKLQQWITESGLSSHMRIVAEKI